MCKITYYYVCEVQFICNLLGVLGLNYHLKLIKMGYYTIISHYSQVNTINVKSCSYMLLFQSLGSVRFFIINYNYM